jgi:hypothetical protein
MLTAVCLKTKAYCQLWTKISFLNLDFELVEKFVRPGSVFNKLLQRAFAFAKVGLI